MTGNDMSSVFQAAMLKRMLPPDPNQILVEKSMEVTADLMRTEGKKAKLELFDAIEAKLEGMDPSNPMYEKYRALAD